MKKFITECKKFKIQSNDDLTSLMYIKQKIYVEEYISLI